MENISHTCPQESCSKVFSNLSALIYHFEQSHFSLAINKKAHSNAQFVPNNGRRIPKGTSAPNENNVALPQTTIALSDSNKITPIQLLLKTPNPNAPQIQAMNVVDGHNLKTPIQAMVKGGGKKALSANSSSKTFYSSLYLPSLCFPNSKGNALSIPHAIKSFTICSKRFNYLELLQSNTNVPNDDFEWTILQNVKPSTSNNTTPAMLPINESVMIPVQPIPELDLSNFNYSTHVKDSGLTTEQIIMYAVLMVDYSANRPYQCPIKGCFKRYKHINCVRYHANSLRDNTLSSQHNDNSKENNHVVHQ
ncbi:uncharacterized protein LOC119667240 [Teleopsis dalmanni]|uniref:uncharacterized protein LOC119667240 n=1 Tax=Teleopsis dalmanni TaxID=139649 RepID=UPI0018CE4EAB|nr:uncharacterized protein LOC119667240 [Teleopsis dalmanni]